MCRISLCLYTCKHTIVISEECNLSMYLCIIDNYHFSLNVNSRFLNRSLKWNFVSFSIAKISKTVMTDFVNKTPSFIN